MSDLLRKVLSEVPRYYAEIAGDIDCCGTYIEFERDDKDGEYVKYQELVDLLKAAEGG